jgi:invasion protein IalB
MHKKCYSLLAAAALGLSLTSGALAQEAPAPGPDATPPSGPAQPSAETSPADAAPSPTAPATEAAPSSEPAQPAGGASPADSAPPATAPGSETGPGGPETAPADAAPAAPPQPGASEAGAPPPAPQQPEIDVTKHGDWEVGCLPETTQCEMQQVAIDAAGNPVILARMVRLPEEAEAQALIVFNTPLGTLLPPGLGVQIDAAPSNPLPFEWCVQEGCIVRLGLREPDVAAMKRGKQVKLRVNSIADPEAPVILTLSLTGFTAGFDSLPIPPEEATPEGLAPAQN